MHIRFKHSVALALLMGGLNAPASAQDVGTAVNRAEQRVNQAANAQNQVDRVYDEVRDRVDAYKSVQKQIEGLQVYIAQLEAQVRNQDRELAEITGSIEEVTVIERQITPLMLRMIDSLEQFVALDLPFKRGERQQRVENLKSVMQRADVTSAEKFRNVMAAFENEIDYGRTIEAYRGVIGSAEEAREVDFLRIGRIGLFYQSLDGREMARWDTGSNAWQPLEGRYRSQIQNGIRMARQQAAPDLIRMPLPTAQGSSS